MKRIGTLKGIPIVEGNSNELKKNNILCNKKDGNIELSKRENGQVSNISGGSSNINTNVIYIKTSNSIDNLGHYTALLMSVRYFGLERREYKIIEFTMGSQAGVSDYWKNILSYCSISYKYNAPTTNSGNEYTTINSLEEFEQFAGLDSNNRPFKIITEEEFYKDLTEEEARKIASEL